MNVSEPDDLVFQIPCTAPPDSRTERRILHGRKIRLMIALCNNDRCQRTEPAQERFGPVKICTAPGNKITGNQDIFRLAGRDPPDQPALPLTEFSFVEIGDLDNPRKPLHGSTVMLHTQQRRIFQHSPAQQRTGSRAEPCP